MSSKFRNSARNDLFINSKESNLLTSCWIELSRNTFLRYINTCNIFQVPKSWNTLCSEEHNCTRNDNEKLWMIETNTTLQKRRSLWRFVSFEDDFTVATNEKVRALFSSKIVKIQTSAEALEISIRENLDPPSFWRFLKFSETCTIFSLFHWVSQSKFPENTNILSSGTPMFQTRQNGEV